MFPPVPLTELCSDDGDVVPRVLLPVQLPEDEHWPVACMDVEHSVHVGASIDGVPAQNTRGVNTQVFVKVCCLSQVSWAGYSHFQSFSGVTWSWNSHIYSWATQNKPDWAWKTNLLSDINVVFAIHPPPCLKEKQKL